MEKTRFKCNGHPVHITNIGSLIYTDKTGNKREALGHSPMCRIIDAGEELLDDTGHNVKYVKKWSVAWTLVDPSLDSVPSPDCKCPVCQSTEPPAGFRRRQS